MLFRKLEDPRWIVCCGDYGPDRSVATAWNQFETFQSASYTWWDPFTARYYLVEGFGSVCIHDQDGWPFHLHCVYCPTYPEQVISASDEQQQWVAISCDNDSVVLESIWEGRPQYLVAYTTAESLPLNYVVPRYQIPLTPTPPPALNPQPPSPSSAYLDLEPSEDDLDEEAAFNAYLWELEHLRLLSLRQPPVDDLHAGKAFAPEAASEDSSGTHTEVGTDTASGAVLALPVLMASAADIFVLPASSAQLPQTPLPPPLQPHTPPAPQHFEIHRDSESRSDDDVGLELSQLIHERGCSALLNLVIPHCVTDLWFLFQQQKDPLGTVSLPLSSAWGNPIGWWKCRSPITRVGIG